MKYYNILFWALSLCALVACSDEIRQEESKLDTQNRGAAVVYTFQGQDIPLKQTDVIAVAAYQEKLAAKEDLETVMDLQENLMGAEKVGQALNVEFSMEEETVESGLFIFSIKTEENQELEFTMVDEEGFATVAQNKFTITKGNNYKALNVEALNTGSYRFRLTDSEGKELSKKVSIDND